MTTVIIALAIIATILTFCGFVATVALAEKFPNHPGVAFGIALVTTVAVAQIVFFMVQITQDYA